MDKCYRVVNYKTAKSYRRYDRVAKPWSYAVGPGYRWPSLWAQISKIAGVPQVTMAWSNVIGEGHSTDNYGAVKSRKVVGVSVNDRAVKSYGVWEYHKRLWDVVTLSTGGQVCRSDSHRKVL